MSEDGETYQIVTANLLRGGEIVYMTLDGDKVGWSGNIRDAYVFEATVADEALGMAETEVKANVVISVYPMEITGAYEPLSERERVRAKGPTVAFGEDAVAANKSGYSI